MNTFMRRGLTFLFASCLLLTLCGAVEETALNGQSSLVPRGYPAAEKHRSDKIHGVVMGLTVVLIFPMGAMSWKLFDRVFSPRTLLWIHIGFQILGFALLIIGFGTGVWVAILHAEVYNDPLGHVVLGTIIVALFFLQPFIGMWHHRLHKASKTNNILRQGHIWFGRILIILGLVNGGLGLDLGANSPGGEKVYGSLAGIIGVLYIGLVVSWYFTRGSKKIENSSDDAGESGERVEAVEVVEPRVEKEER